MSKRYAGNRTSRRDFLKKAAVSTAAVTVTAGLAKKVVGVATEVDAKRAYREDILAGDRAWRDREYVVMTDTEKRELVRTFIDNYRYETL